MVDYKLYDFKIGIKNPKNANAKSVIVNLTVDDSIKKYEWEYNNNLISLDIYKSCLERVKIDSPKYKSNLYVNVNVSYNSGNINFNEYISISGDVPGSNTVTPYDSIPSKDIILSNVFWTMGYIWKDKTGEDGTIWDLIEKIDNTTSSALGVTPIVATPSTIVATSSVSSKINLTIIGLGDDPIVEAKTDIGDFLIYIGDEPKPQPDVYDNLEELDSEYQEGVFRGNEEWGVTIEQYSLDQLVSEGQEDNSIGLTEPGDPVDIKPVYSLDGLLELAGKCARTLGKNPRVKFENLKKGYKKSIHGLCPQGTQVVLYAMTGVKDIQPNVTSANWLSFGKKSGNKFTSTESKMNLKYFNDKDKISKDYWNDSSKWQIGDVVAYAYNLNKHGHIQVWTGKKWMSDFTQNNLQTFDIDKNTIALWRMNQNGLELVKKQMGTIV